MARVKLTACMREPHEAGRQRAGRAGVRAKGRGRTGTWTIPPIQPNSVVPLLRSEVREGSVVNVYMRSTTQETLIEWA